MANKLFIPGPTEVRKEILDELSRPQIGHRTQEFKDLFGSLKPGLKRLFFTENDVLISTSSGSGLWEAAIRCCVSKKVLHAVNGSFSKKWSKLSESCGKEAGRIEYDWGKAVKASDVDEELSKGDYEAFCMVHCETSTGVASDLEAISEVMKKHPNVLWIVDAVSSLAGIKIETDRLGIDVCLASSQKALALPAGIAVVSVSGRAYKKAENVAGRGYYFDILELKKMYDKDQTPYTASIPHLYALKKQLERIDEEGLENRFNRHKEMADYVRSWARENGLEMFSEKGYRSNTVSCIENTRKLDFKAIKKNMATKGYSMDSGYRKLNEKLDSEGKPNTFRIAHMGDLSLEEIKEFTSELEKYF
ncbi:alanine--glyoxylate aminotransferase family protein [Candidatus Woesearchaeota archaeon]|nr:alanine--glyoxylate aminotransferase family protein [Candidatus Woesearchaeota archaeon]